MFSYYIYFISTLPALEFGVKPPFSFDKFLETAQQFIPEKDIVIIRISAESPGYVYEGTQPTLKKWFTFDTALRNELVKIRASRRHIDPGKYLREDGYLGPSITHIVLNAYRTLSILEAERFLDQERWRFLDELSLGHYFDMDILIVYALKLLILERWEQVNSGDRVKVLEETVKI